MKKRGILITCLAAGIAVVAGCSSDETDPLSGQTASIGSQSKPSIDAHSGTTFGHDEMLMTPQQARMQWLAADSTAPGPASPVSADAQVAVPQ